MSFLRQAGFDAGRVFALFSVGPEAILPVSGRERELLALSGLGWTEGQYAAFQLFCGTVFGLACAVAFTFASVFLGVSGWLVLVSLPCALFGVAAARAQVAGLARGRQRSVEANLLGALRHFSSELSGGSALFPALAAVGRGRYGAVSGLVSEALALVREGESFESAFGEVGGRSGNASFKSFSALVAQAHSSGADLRGVVERFCGELELSEKSALSAYANECSRTSTLAVVLTGVLPGMLLFVFVESGFVFGFRIPIEAFLVSYLLLFPLAKYSLQARLAQSNPWACPAGG